MLRFYLDTLQFEDPIGWDSFTESIEWEQDLSGLVIKYPSNLTFFGGGYAYIRSKYNSQSLCSSITLKVEGKCADGAYEEIFTGTIFIADCKFNISKCIVECPVEDVSYTAKISNNKNIKAKLTAPFSKNGVAITGALQLALDFWNNTTGLLTGNNRRAIDLGDAVRYMIDFCTDGQVDFYSAWYTNLNPYQKLCLMTGKEMRLYPNTSVPVVSLAEIIVSINRLYNLAFGMEKVGGVWRFRWEPIDYFRNNTTAFEISYVPDLKQSFFTEELYANLKIGSPSFDKYDAVKKNVPNDIYMVGFGKEEYYLEGNCNVATTLDLTPQFITDNNIVEEVTNYDPTNDQYDDDVFLLVYDSVNNWVRHTDYLNFGNRKFINDELRNVEVVKRWNLGGSLYLFLGDGNETFKVNRPSVYSYDNGNLNILLPGPSYLQNPFEYPVETSDPDDNWNGSLHRFTAPEDGLFTLDLEHYFWQIICPNYSLDIANKFEMNITLTLEVRHYTSGGTLITEAETFDREILQMYFMNSPDPIDPATQSYNVTSFTKFYRKVDISGGYFKTVIPNYYMNAGEYLSVYYRIQSNFTIGTSWNVSDGNFVGRVAFNAGRNDKFEMISSTIGGGLFAEKEPNEYFQTRFEFETPVDFSTWQDFKNDMTRNIEFNGDGGPNRKGWVKNMKRNLKTGNVTFELITNELNS